MPIENGHIISTSRAASRLLADYVEMAQNNQLDTLYKKLQENTRHVDAHPNHVILVATIIMAARKFAVGESSIPEILRLGRALPERMDMSAGLWLPPTQELSKRHRSGDEN